MARRRMIDPNFWTSEDIAKLNMTQRLLMIGMFSNADDYGKGRANPVYLRSVIFPYDDISIKQIESDLAVIYKHINIAFYEIDGSQYYIFTKWNEWQRVDKPQPSKIPDPTEESFQEPFQELVENDSGLKEKKLKEVKNKYKGKEDKGNEKPSSPPYQKIIDLYNNTCQSLPQVKILTDSRKDKIKARWEQLNNIDLFEQAFTLAESSDFIKGKNDRGWKANFDWLMENDKNIVKVLEGNFNNQRTTKPNTGLDNIKELFFELENEGGNANDEAGYD
ncbi:MAG: hypothetical protein ACM3KR_01095 [Deltaproteobacteria bacterium]